MKKYTIELSEPALKLFHGIFMEGLESGGCHLSSKPPEDIVEEIQGICKDITDQWENEQMIKTGSPTRRLQ
jgi:hypothetical protein